MVKGGAEFEYFGDISVMVAGAASIVGANSNGIRRTWRRFRAAIRASASTALDRHAPSGGLKVA
jgi:hypothetical protein